MNRFEQEILDHQREQIEHIEKSIDFSCDKAIYYEIEKARSGIYQNTSENRKKGIVGAKYGATKPTELKKEESISKEERENQNLSKEEWDILPGEGDIRYYKGKIYVKNRAEIYKIRDYFNHYEKFLQHDQQKLFYRATNNKGEPEIKDLVSKNHLTGYKENGVSVYYTDIYMQKSTGAQESEGKKYIGVVSGKFSGFGSDGEPLLKEIKWELSPTEKLPTKYKRENIEKKRELTEEETPWNKLSFSPFDKDVIVIDSENEIIKSN